MRIRFEAPKKDPKVSIEADLTEEQVKTGLQKLYHFIKSKLPFRLEVGKNGDNRR